MGRPLYSQSFQAPIVRVEPEPEAYPAPEKWSYWNRFDPDADEFFENDDAVYEAVIDASQPPVRMQATGESIRVVIEDSSVSSDESSSGRDSPLQDYPDVRAEGTAEWVVEGRTIPERVPQRFFAPPTSRNPNASADESVTLGIEANRNDEPPADHLITTHVFEYRSHERRPLLPNTPASSNVLIPDSTPRRSPSPGPVTSPSDRQSDIPDSFHNSAGSPAPMTPSTPPNQRSILYDTPSPAPTVTPRLFQWTIRPVAAMPMSPSPTSTGPLTNHSARRSVTHISPVSSLIPIHRVVG